MRSRAEAVASTLGWAGTAPLARRDDLDLSLLLRTCSMGGGPCLLARSWEDPTGRVMTAVIRGT